MTSVFCANWLVYPHVSSWKAPALYSEKDEICKCLEVNVMSTRSTIISFYNFSDSPSIAIVESSYHRVVENGTLSLHCIIEDANPPVSSVYWNKNNSEVTEKANVTIHNISRAEAGNYTCNAFNDIGVGFENVYVDVLCKYLQPSSYYNHVDIDNSFYYYLKKKSEQFLQRNFTIFQIFLLLFIEISLLWLTL